MGQPSAIEAAPRPFLRIAVPAWRLPRRHQAEEAPGRRGLNRAEVTQLFKMGPRPSDVLYQRLTASERAQLAMASRLRDALYAPEDRA
jgi:hypothetical protein